MRESPLHFVAPQTLVLLVFLLLAACAGSTTPTPQVIPRAGPSWEPQQAIDLIQETPFSLGEQAWNAEFDRFSGRWQVTLVYDVRKLYSPRDERQTIVWYVYEDTGKVEGPIR